MRLPKLRISARVVLAFILLAASSIGWASTVPIDPEILFGGAEGDAMDITSGTVSITLGPNGGGIFSFHNASGGPLASLAVDVLDPAAQLQGASFDVNFSSNILAGQQASFGFTGEPNTICGACIEVRFSLTPGPLIATNDNFVLDFNAKVNGVYVGVDALVANGTYTGGTDPSGFGNWPAGAIAGVTPVAAVPEPGYFGLFALGGLFVAIRQWRARSSQR